MAASAAHGAKTLAAVSLVRAFLVDDAAAGVLIIGQNGGEAAGRAGVGLEELLLQVTGLAVRCLLASNGYDVAKSLAVVDQWMGVYARDAGS